MPFRRSQPTDPPTSIEGAQRTNGRSGFIANHWFQLTLVALMVFMIVWAGRMLTEPKVTQREVAFITVILTLASVVASALVSLMYAELSSRQSLRDQGVQIAIGMLLLKNQITKLYQWLEEDSATANFSSSDSGARYSIMHVGETLSVFRDMIDASLTAIAGIIGDALKQYEDVMDKISNVRADALKQTTEIQHAMKQTTSSAELVELQAKVEQIAADMNRQISELARSSTLPIPRPSSSRVVSVQCPSPVCGQINSFEMKDRAGETQLQVCTHCRARFNVHIGADGRPFTRSLAIARSSQPANHVTTFLDDRWIEPEKLARLINLMVAVDKRLSAQEKSPFNLLGEVLKSDELLESGISHSTVRRFFFRIHKSGAFIFAGPRGFRDQYVNELTEDLLLAACVRAYLFMLRKGHVKIGGAPELAQALFGQAFPSAEAALQHELSQVTPGSQPATP